MKKKYIGFIICAFICCGAATGAVYIHHKVNVQHLHMDFVEQKSNFKEVVSSSDLIVRGKVTKVTPTNVHGIIFTYYELNVDKIIKGTPQKIVVSILGGKVGAQEQVVDGIKQLDKGKEYLFCLQKVYPDQPNDTLYAPIGALQGIYAIDEPSSTMKAENKDNIKLKPFNKNNTIEKTIIGKELSETKDLK